MNAIMLSNKESPTTNDAIIHETKIDGNATLDDNDAVDELEPFNEDEFIEEIQNDNVTITNGDTEKNEDDDDEGDEDEDLIDEFDDNEEGNKDKENEIEEQDSTNN